MGCTHHPAATGAAHCAACLLEEALLVPKSPRIGLNRLTIQLPLGQTSSASVFLVRDEYPPRLLRLKVWRESTAPGFLARFHRLVAALASWRPGDIVRPLDARIDANGCPSVLTEFSQGVPILDRIRAGRLEPDHAIERLGPLIALTEQAHTRGLVHGSIVPGNVIVDPDSGRTRLLDFGLRALLIAPDGHLPQPSADLAGFAELLRMVGECRPPAPPQRS